MNVLSKVLVLLGCLGLTGCMPSEIVSQTEHYLADAALIDNHQGTGGPNFVLYPNSRIHVVAAPQTHAFPELDGWLLIQTAGALRHYFPEVTTNHEPQQFPDALQQGRSFSAHYLVITEPLFAEDQYGHWDEWEDMPRDFYDTGRDTVSLRFRLYSVADGRLIGTWRYRSRSGLLTFINDIPDDLTEPAATSFAKSLSARP